MTVHFSGLLPMLDVQRSTALGSDASGSSWPEAFEPEVYDAAQMMLTTY